MSSILSEQVLWHRGQRFGTQVQMNMVSVPFVLVVGFVSSYLMKHIRVVEIGVMEHGMPYVEVDGPTTDHN